MKKNVRIVILILFYQIDCLFNTSVLFHMPLCYCFESKGHAPYRKEIHKLGYFFVDLDGHVHDSGSQLPQNGKEKV